MKKTLSSRLARVQKVVAAVNRLKEELSGARSLEELLEKIILLSREVLGYDNAIIRLLNPATRTLDTLIAYGYSLEAQNRVIRIGEGIMGRVAETGKAWIVGDITKERNYIRGIDEARSELAVPLHYNGKIIGVFNVESREFNAFDETDKDLLQGFTKLVVGALTQFNRI